MAAALAHSSATGCDRQQFTRLRMLRALDQWLDVERVSAAAVELATVVGEFQPDLILSEMFVAAAGLGGRAI